MIVGRVDGVKMVGRRRAAVAAARFLFVRHGIKGTTMEAIAAEAGIAKATLYSYFADKDAVLIEVMNEVVTGLEQTFEAALAGHGGVVDRVGAALAAKYKAGLRLIDGSPHAAEFYNEQGRLAGPAFAALATRIEAAIVRELEAAGVERARPLTQILTAAAGGIGHKAQSASEIGPAIRLLTERLLGPEVR